MLNIISKISMLKLFSMFLLLVIQFQLSCQQKTMVNENGKENEIYTLDWKGYDGLGNPRKAIYILNDVYIGEGKNGIDLLKENINRMKQGDIILLRKDYDHLDKGHPPKEYPFQVDYHDEEGEFKVDLIDYAEKRGVKIIPEKKYYEK